jgi:general secretion pathway protein H
LVTGVRSSRSQQPACGRLFAFCGRHAARGFTLLELMVVLVIISIILTFVSLSVGGDPRGEELQREARRLVALLEMASDEAVLSSQQLAVRFSEDGYQFMALRGGQWLALSEDPLLRERTLPEGIQLRLELEDNPPPSLITEDSDLPQVFLLSSGEMTPFVVTLSAPESERRFLLKASLLGQLELE